MSQWVFSSKYWIRNVFKIWDEMLTVFTHLQQMETKLRRLEQEKQPYDADYDQLQLDYKDQGGYQ